MESLVRQPFKVESGLAPSVADQAAMFRVLEDCSEGHATFAERLLEALERHLGLRHSICWAGSTSSEALLAPALAARGRTQQCREPYIERYAEHDIFRTPVAQRRFERIGSVGLWDFSGDEVARHRLYFDDFLARFGMPGIFVMKIEAAVHLPLYVSIHNYEGQMPQADLRRLLPLRRLLGSQLATGERNAQDDATSQLTTREQEIVKLIGRGYSNEMIACALGIKVDSVKKRLTSIFVTCGVTSRTQLAVAMHSRAAGL